MGQLRAPPLPRAHGLHKTAAMLIPRRFGAVLVLALAVTPDDVADAVVEGVQEQRELIWVPKPMRFVMSGLRHVPRPLFRKLPI